MATIALPIVAVTYLDATERETGMIQAAATGAFLLIGLPAGAWIDRISKRRVMIVANLARAVLMGAVPALYLANVLNVSWLIALALGLGFATVFFDVSYMSLTPQIVRREHLHAANSALTTAETFARVAGPGASGLLARAIPAPFLLGGGTIGYLASAFAASRLRVDDTPRPASGRSLGAEVREGARFVFLHPLLSRTAIAVSIWAGFNQMAQALMAILVLRQMGVGTGEYGLIFTVAAIASLAGPWIATKSVARFGAGPTIVWSMAVSAIPPLVAYVVADVAPVSVGYWTIMATFCVGWAALPVFNITHLTLRQQLCPPELMGRMNATMRFAMWGVTPIGALVGGELGERIGMGHTFVIALVGAVASWLLLAGSRVRHVKTAAQWLADNPDEAARADALVAGSGPVMAAEAFATAPDAGAVVGSAEPLAPSSTPGLPDFAGGGEIPETEDGAPDHPTASRP